jgi:hypothetical protein
MFTKRFRASSIPQRGQSVLDRFGGPAVPYETDFIQSLSAFAVHFLFLSTSALHCHPIAKMDRALDLVGGHVAMTFVGFERLECLKCLFPPLITLIPYKPNLIELCLPPAIEFVLVVTLNGDPLAEPIAILLVITGNGAMPLTLSKRKESGNAPIPSFFGKQPSALSNHHKLARITLVSCDWAVYASLRVQQAVCIDLDQIGI